MKKKNIVIHCNFNGIWIYYVKTNKPNEEQSILDDLISMWYIERQSKEQTASNYDKSLVFLNYKTQFNRGVRIRELGKMKVIIFH